MYRILMRVLISLSYFCRGLDMPARVHHIVNFDFPYNPVDYIHRAGRTARAGMTGKITSLLQKKDMTLATRIQDAIKNNRPLDDLSATKSELPQNMRSELFLSLFSLPGPWIAMPQQSALFAQAWPCAWWPADGHLTFFLIMESCIRLTLQTWTVEDHICG